MTILKKEKVYVANIIQTSFGEIANAQSGSSYDSQSDYVDIITAGGDGLLIDEIIITSNDSAARVAVIARKVSSTYRPIGAVSIPANAGTNGTTAAIDALSGAIIAGLAINSQGKRYIRLDAGEGLAFKTTTAVTNTAGMAVRCSVSGVEFESGI
jgi:hypothetical protein